MKSTDKASLTIVQMNDTHAYFDLHQEMFWHGDHPEYRQAGGYARVATIVKQIRAESQNNCLFCDCADTLHGTYPALDTQGKAMIPILNSLGIDAMTAHWEFAYSPMVFNHRLAELNYPMLANNIYDKATKLRQHLTEQQPWRLQWTISCFRHCLKVPVHNWHFRMAGATAHQ